MKKFEKGDLVTFKHPINDEPIDTIYTIGCSSKVHKRNRKIIYLLEKGGRFYASDFKKVKKQKMAQNTIFKVGDKVWIFLDNHQGKRTKGKVLMILDIPGWFCFNYLIEISTDIEPLLQVRSVSSMYRNQIRKQ